MINMKTMMIRSVRGHDDVRIRIRSRHSLIQCFFVSKEILEISASREMCHLNWLPIIAYDHTLTGILILL